MWEHYLWCSILSEQCVEKLLARLQSLHWAMLNASEVVIPWELQVSKFQSRFSILSFCEK